MGTRRHSINELSKELTRILPTYSTDECMKLALLGCILGDVTIRTDKLYVVIKDGRFYTAYKRPKSQQRTIHSL